MTTMPPQENSDAPPDDVTPEPVYNSRRWLLRAGILAATALATGDIYEYFNAPSNARVKTKKLAAIVKPKSAADRGFTVPDRETSFKDITHYNNFYEFSTDKNEVANDVSHFTTAGWKVEVGGLVSRPQTFDLDALLKVAPIEQRIYRMRCVEAWSMVIPWDGFSLSHLLKRVAPLSSAKYVAFQTLFNPKLMPNQNSDVLQWPYIEGLRMDEAMHPLTILASGIYGRTMPAQDGAPVRLVIPWKYGFKGIKSIVKITLVADQPPTTWNIAEPGAYGFYANVNPHVPHPRWSQAREQRIGVPGWRPTLMFNGYGAEVASLYKGMNLRKYY